MSSEASPAHRLFDAIGSQLVLRDSFGGEGPRVGDEYELTGILGAGGFGLICRAENLSLRREVALKLFPLPNDASARDGVREALREARSLARLDHPNVVAVYAAGESEVVTSDHVAGQFPCAYVEMQLVAGQTLRDWLEVGPQGPEVLRVLLEAGRGLASAHAKGLVHRDFKPENLMVDTAGQARVIDFGLALAAEIPVDTDANTLALADWNPRVDALGARVTQAGSVRGTPGYMAPEAVAGQAMAASDQFAFAVVVREALSGRHPFASPNAPERMAPEGGPQLLEVLAPLIERAMAPAPADRFASIRELCDRIEAELAPSSERTRRPRMLPTLLAGVLGFGLLGAGAFAWSRIAPSDAPAPAEPDPAPPPRMAEESTKVPPQPTPAPQPAPAELAAREQTQEQTCADLEAWAGAWKVAGKVAWTEFAYQLDWVMEYEYELRPDAQCNLQLIAREYPPRLEDELPGEPVQTETSAVARPEAGSWRVAARLAFPDERRTYGSDEHYELVLVLGREGERETLSGAFRRFNEKGYPIRTGALVGARGVVPELLELEPDALPCAARCHLECAGRSAARSCRKAACEGLEPGGPLCGAPSREFNLPMRAITALRQLRADRDIMAEAHERSGLGHLERCPVNARALAGTWVVWAELPSSSSSEAIELELSAEGCELVGRAKPKTSDAAPPADPTPMPVSGYVTGAGTWVIEPSEPRPWFPAELILVGVAERGAALGSDASEPPRPLRARKL